MAAVLSVVSVSHPSLWQQEVEMWLCWLPVLMDALTSVSQHCGEDTQKEGSFSFGCHSEIFHFSWVTLHMRKQPVTTVH